MEWSVYLVIALGVFCMHIIFGWGSSDKKQEEHTEPPQLDLSQVEEEISQAEEEMSQEQELLQVEQETRDTMLQIVRDIGCQPVVGEEGVISATFQREHFMIDCHGRCAKIYDPIWSFVCIRSKEFPLLCNAINEVNMYSLPSIIYVYPDENGMVGLSTCTTLYIHPECPDNEVYVRGVLEAFFDIKDDFRDELLKQFGLQTPELLDPHSEEHSCHIQEIRHQMPS